MPWMQLHSSFRNHRKLNALARRLRIDALQARGLVINLWLEVLNQDPDGDLRSWSEDDVFDMSGAEVAGAQSPEALVEALVEAGWLDRGPEGLRVHGWSEYTTSYRKAQTRARQREEQAAREATEREAASAAETTASAAETRAKDQVSDTYGENVARQSRDGRATVVPSSRDGRATVAPRGEERNREERRGEDRDTASPAPALPGLSAPPDPKKEREAAVTAVIEHYRSAGHPRASPRTKGLRGMVSGRLKEGWTAAELCRAIDALHTDTWSDRPNYLGLEHAIGSEPRVRKWLERAGRSRSSHTYNDRERRNAQAAAAFLEGEDEDAQPRRTA